MKITTFLTKKIDSKQDAVEHLAEFVGEATSESFPGTTCPNCYENISWCDCKQEEVSRDSLDDMINEAGTFAVKWEIPFDKELFLKIVNKMKDSPDAIWNSSSAYC